MLFERKERIVLNGVMHPIRTLLNQYHLLFSPIRTFHFFSFSELFLHCCGIQLSIMSYIHLYIILCSLNVLINIHVIIFAVQKNKILMY